MDNNNYYSSSMNQMGGGYYPNGQPMMPQEGMMPEGIMMPPDGYPPRLYQLQTLSSENLNHFSDIEDSNRAALPQQGGSRNKRRPIPGADHVKHRRTRSGCYTCRQRRVKCDETRPTCERCRKGKRECNYPEPTASSSKAGRSSSKSKGSAAEGSHSSGEDFDLEDRERLASIPDEDDAEVASSLGSKDDRKLSDASSTSRDHSPLVKSPATTESSITSTRSIPRPNIPRQSSRKSLKTKQPTNTKWAHLPKDVRFYMNFHRDKLTHHYYAMKYDVADFLKTTFLEIALGYEPLLYAITAFAAYHHTLTSRSDGKIQNFLGYYNKSVSLLRQSLERSPRHTVATLLTILQLATFEEFLGDWVNLMGHQRAAYEILTELFTPQTIMQSETHRKIISWYIRFDLFAGFMHGYGMVLSREWHVACMDFYTRQARDRPKDLNSLFEEKFAKSRLLATDISMMFAKAKAEGPTEDLAKELARLGTEMATTEYELENAFKDTRTYVKEFPGAPKGEWDDVVNSTDPDFLWAGELFTWNFILIDFWSIHLLFKSQVAQFDPTFSGEEIVKGAFKVCKMFEALEFCGQDVTAMVLGGQASLGMAAACMPKDQRHTMWSRRKYALIEKCGYIYPAALRKRMTDVWGEDVTRWWLPNDNEYPPILQAVREFIDYRATVPQDAVQTDLRDMKGLFSALQLDENETKASTGSYAGTDSDQYEFESQSGQAWDSSPDVQNWT